MTRNKYNKVIDCFDKQQVIVKDRESGKVVILTELKNRADGGQNEYYSNAKGYAFDKSGKPIEFDYEFQIDATCPAEAFENYQMCADKKEIEIQKANGWRPRHKDQKQSLVIPQIGGRIGGNGIGAPGKIIKI